LVPNLTWATGPEITGNAGATYETQVAACYLTALLVGGEAQGLTAATVESVALQRKALGDPLDDCVIVARRRDGRPAKVQLQAKRELRLSAAASNADFREIVTASLTALSSPDFRSDADRFGGVTESIAQEPLRAAHRLHDLALFSLTAADFADQLASGAHGASTLKVEADVRAIMAEILNRAPTAAEIWGFWRHALVLRLETMSEGAGDRHAAVERLRAALQPDDAHRANDLFDVLEGLVRGMNAAAGALDRKTLLERLAGRFAFKADNMPKSLEDRSSAVREAARRDLEGFRRQQANALGAVPLLLTPPDDDGASAQIDPAGAAERSATVRWSSLRGRAPARPPACCRSPTRS